MSFCRPMVEFKGSKGNLLKEGGNTTIEGQNKLKTYWNQVCNEIKAKIETKHETL